MSPWAQRVVFAAAAVAMGCGAGDGTAGMSGRQVAQGHDVADLFFADSSTLAYTRQALDTSLPGPEDMWVWGFADAAPAVGLANIDWTQPRTQPIARYGELLATGPTGRRFFDFASRHAVDLEAVTPSSLDAGITVDGGTVGADMLYPPLTALRRDGQAVALTGVAPGAVSVGPPDSLQSLSLPGAVGAMRFLGGDLALVYVATPESDPAAGIYRLAVPSGELTELVPPTPVADWADALGTCRTLPCPAFMVAGCAANDSPCPGTSAPPCAIVYVKSDPDNPGHTATFGYDVNAGQGFKLPGMDPTHLYLSPDQKIVLYDDDRYLSKRYWSLCGGREDFCNFLTGDFVLWRPDARGFASVSTDGSGQMSIATFDDGNFCTGATVMPSVYWAIYTPASDGIAFLVSQDPLASVASETMFLARSDGSGLQQIATGSLTGGRFSRDGTKLYIARASTSSVALNWLDLTTTPPTEHLLANDYAGFSSGGNRRVLLIDHWNTQDTSGELALYDVDVAGGNRQSLGRAVTDFAVSGDVDGMGANVAYAVRSRAPSPRDGVWLTTLPP